MEMAVSSVECDVDSGLDFQETELKLALPGGRSAAGGAERKRGFSDTVEFTLGNSRRNNLSRLPSAVSSEDRQSVESAESVVCSPGKPPAAKAQVVGWPPVRSFRKNVLKKSCKYVKVAVDGAPYLRKVDLETYSGYQQLLKALEEMFSCFTIGDSERRLVRDPIGGIEYVPTYEDKEDDWMLVGDVPWKMFVESCKRIRGFMLNRVNVRPTSHSCAEVSEVETETIPEPKVIQEPVKPKALPAKWLPIGGIKAPLTLDGTLAADVGFDPIGFSRSKNGLYWMREAEVKHARLAMLAAVGWPLSELWHKNIASVLGLDSILANGDRAPSLLNGGLSSGWATSILIMSILAAGFLESKAMTSGEIFWTSEKPEGYVPGALGFDPLGFYGAKGDKKTMETAEIKNGRLAMIAITAYAFQEFATQLPVVEQTPYLF